MHSNDRDDRFIRKNVKFSEIDNARGAFRCMFRLTIIYTPDHRPENTSKKGCAGQLVRGTFECSDNFDCRVAP